MKVFLLNSVMHHITTIFGFFPLGYVLRHGVTMGREGERWGVRYSEEGSRSLNVCVSSNSFLSPV